MSRSVRITSPLPSVTETAERAGVPATRARELVSMAEQLELASSSSSIRAFAAPPPAKPVKKKARKAAAKKRSR